MRHVRYEWNMKPNYVFFIIFFCCNCLWCLFFFCYLLLLLLFYCIQSTQCVAIRFILLLFTQMYSITNEMETTNEIKQIKHNPSKLITCSPSLHSFTLFVVVVDLTLCILRCFFILLFYFSIRFQFIVICLIHECYYKFLFIF